MLVQAPVGLPLRVLTCATASGVVTADLNPDLPAMLSRFAYYLNPPVPGADTAAPGPLNKNVFDQWVSKFLVMTGDTPAPVQISGLNAYQLNLPASATAAQDLLTAIKPTLEGDGPDALYAHIGLFLFTAWFFLVDSADGLMFGDPVKTYVTKNCLPWQLPLSRNRAVTIHSSWLIDSTKLPTDFEYRTPLFRRALRASKTSLWQMASAGDLGYKSLFRVPSSLSSAAQDRARNRAGFEFVRFYRNLFSEMLQREFLFLLEKISPGSSRNLGPFGLYSVGDGSSSLGYFGVDGLGLSFFNYDYEQLSSTEPPYIKARLTQETDIWCPYDSGAPVLFLAQWGIQPGGSSSAVVTVGGNPNPLPIVSTHTDGDNYLQTVSDKQFAYDHDSGLLTISGCPTDEVGLKFTSAGADEVAFFLCSYLPLPDTTLPLPGAQLRIDYLFQDNAFAVPTPDALAFWNAVPQQNELNQLVLNMRDDPGFTLKASISGQGIGRRVDVYATDEFNSDLESSDDQTDNEIPNTVALENVGLRYAYGDAVWTPGRHGRPGVLTFCTEGFASPLRCTWETWADFQVLVDGVTKASLLQTEIGDCLRPSPLPHPSYNVALSAFRAYGLLEAMIKRMKDCADDLTPSQLTSTQRDAIALKLDTFLQTQTSSALLQVGLDRLAGVTITYAMFQKYAY